MRAARAALLGLSAALAAATLLRLPGAWASGNALNHVSGAWMTLADDLAHGTFYRPLADPALGYGGTRFFPLAFAIHGAARATGADLVASGFAVSLAAGALLAVALFLLVRRAGTARAEAAAFAALAFAAVATQHALSSVRGDLLPVALSALGLWTVAGPALRARRLVAAALLLALAFAAKPTALTAAGAAASWLWLRGERRAATALAVLVAAGCAAVVAGTDALSDGRFLAILAGTATGGAGAGDLARGPFRFAEHLVVADPAALWLAFAGALASAGALRARLAAARCGEADPALLASLWLGAAACGAVIVFASPGTGVNHLVELEAAAAAALGTAFGAGAAKLGARPAARHAAGLARALAPAVALAGVVVAVGTAREDGRTARLAEARRTAAALPADGRVLSEDPLVPLVAGRRPEVLDPWMLRLALDSDPDLARPLVERLRRGEYGAVILFHDPDAPEARRWYARGNLGDAVIDAIRDGYRFSERRGRYRIYVPRARAPVARDPLASVPAG